MDMTFPRLACLLQSFNSFLLSVFPKCSSIFGNNQYPVSTTHSFLQSFFSAFTYFPLFQSMSPNFEANPVSDQWEIRTKKDRVLIIDPQHGKEKMRSASQGSHMKRGNKGWMGRRRDLPPSPFLIFASQFLCMCTPAAHTRTHTLIT